MSSYDCRTYVDHLQLQHHHIQQMLERLRTLVVGAEGCEVAFQDAKRLMNELTNTLAHHFAEEAGGGCLEEAVCRCPRLSPRAQAIYDQHPQLMALARQIAARFSDCDRLGRTRPAVEQEVEQLASSLRRLEYDERKLLAEAFGMDEGCAARTSSAPPAEVIH